MHKCGAFLDCFLEYESWLIVSKKPMGKKSEGDFAREPPASRRSPAPSIAAAAPGGGDQRSPRTGLQLRALEGQAPEERAG